MVVKEFDEVELYWLLNGKGSFPNAASVSSEKPEVRITEEVDSLSPTDDQKEIERIVVFYKDGSFKAYRP